MIPHIEFIQSCHKLKLQNFICCRHRRFVSRLSLQTFLEARFWEYLGLMPMLRTSLTQMSLLPLNPIRVGLNSVTVASSISVAVIRPFFTTACKNQCSLRLSLPNFASQGKFDLYLEKVAKEINTCLKLMPANVPFLSSTLKFIPLYNADIVASLLQLKSACSDF